MMKTNPKIILALLAGLALLPSCKKEFLDTIPNKSILVPTTLSDFQAILDNTSVMNLSPEIGMIASDEFYTTADGLTSLSTPTERGSYLWAEDPYQGQSVVDWDDAYQQVFYCNVVLEGLVNSTEKASADFNPIKGTALFYRGLAYYNLSQVFAVPYDPATAGQAMGIPLKASADINEKVTRGTLAQTYNQLLSDLKGAIPLLPLRAAYKSRPDKAAAYGLLARAYLSMSVYDQAGAYADSSLQLNHTLNNYTAYDPTAYRPFPLALPDNNDEVDFDTTLLPYSFDESALTFADSTLYRSYSDNDLRKPLFFVNNGPGGVNFQGTYTGTYSLFNGVATDEMYLIRAEASARTGHAAAALSDLNTLLATRWKTGTYTPFSSSDPTVLLTEILAERRKELFARGLRWSDLRRLNTDPRFAITLKRVISGQTYTLPPQDKRYVFPIPGDEISLSGVPQNSR